MTKRLIVAAVVVLFAFVTTAPAQARHHQHHYHHQVYHQAPHAPRVRLAAMDAPGFLQSLFGSVGAGASNGATAARRYLGETASQVGLRSHLWCADFVNMIERKAGRAGTGSSAARSFLHYGHRTSPQVGAIVVLARGGGGHVGYVTGFDRGGNPIVLSGNHGHRVGEGTYDRHRVLAYVMP